MNISAITLILTIIGVIWIVQEQTLKSFSFLNDLRDLIILGKKDGEVLTKEHKLVILKQDWFPLYMGILSTMFLYLIILGIITLMVWKIEILIMFKILTSVPFLVTLFKCGSTLFFFKREYKFILSFI